MRHDTISNWLRGRAMAAVACAAIATPLIGCGSGSSGNSGNASGANLPPVNDYATGGGRGVPMQSAPPQRQGMSTGKKLVLLAGAAAVYYMWKKHNEAAKNAPAGSQNNQTYYLSKNGQIYYRVGPQVHYVTPPPQGYQVSPEEAQQYQGLQQLQGYNGSQTGTTDLSRFAASNGGM